MFDTESLQNFAMVAYSVTDCDKSEASPAANTRMALLDVPCLARWALRDDGRLYAEKPPCHRRVFIRGWSWNDPSVGSVNTLKRHSMLCCSTRAPVIFHVSVLLNVSSSPGGLPASGRV